jgi:hypothetical protein
MFTGIRFRHMAIVWVLCCVVLPGSKGFAQLYCSPDWTPEYKCLEHCGPCAGTSSGSASCSGGNYGGAIGEIIGLPGDIIRAHKRAKEAREAKKLTELNDQGIAAYDKKDWAAAEVEFKKVLQLNPSDHVYLRNLAMTQGHEGEDAYLKGDYTTAFNYFQQALANDPADDPDKQTLDGDLATVQGKIDDIRRDQERRDQDKLAASKMQQSIQNFAQSLSTAPSSNTAPSSGGLDFNDGNSGNNANKSSGLTFMDSDHDAVADSKPATGSTQQSTCPFNTTCNPANPNLGGSSPATSTANSGTGALNQARVAAGQGNVAQQTTSDSSASEAARHPFDTPGGVAAPMPVAVGSPASAPVPDRIKNTPGYKAMAAEKEKLQNRMNELDSRLTDIRAEQAKSQAPNQALAMEAAKIKQEMSPIRGEMLLKQQQIDKFVVSMEEESVPDKGKDKTPPKTAITVPSPTQ